MVKGGGKVEGMPEFKAWFGSVPFCFVLVSSLFFSPSPFAFDPGTEGVFVFGEQPSVIRRVCLSCKIDRCFLLENNLGGGGGIVR